MPTVLPASGEPLVFLDITIGGQTLTRLPIELLPPTPSTTAFHAQCVSAPPGYKNSRISRIIRGVGVYGGSDPRGAHQVSGQAAGGQFSYPSPADGELLGEGVVGLLPPSAGFGNPPTGVPYIISFGAARGVPVGRVFGTGGEEALRMLAGVATGRRGEGVPDLEVGVGECGEL